MQSTLQCLGLYCGSSPSWDESACGFERIASSFGWCVACCSPTQENIKTLQQQADLYAAQLQSQARETRAARETLAEAEAEIAEVQFDKKQLLAQWRSVLTAVQR